jgi:hypothetical protein
MMRRQREMLALIQFHCPGRETGEVPTGGDRLDCRVVLISHETGEEQRESPSLAEFVEELLTAVGA